MDQRTFIYALCVERKLCEAWACNPAMSLNEAARAAKLTGPDLVMCALMGDCHLNYEELSLRNEMRIRRLRPTEEVMRSFFDDLLPSTTRQ